MEIVVAVTAGLFSLLGAFAGAALARRTDYEKWLRENRSEVFAKFLELLSEAQKNATDAMFDNSMEQLAQDIKVTEAYRPALDYARVVCLYLPKEKRKEFRALAKEFWALHSTRGMGDSRLLKMPEKLEAIQKIFEECL
jgi:hypothetical protein